MMSGRIQWENTAECPNPDVCVGGVDGAVSRLNLPGVKV
jgi:hypothetical protein